MDLPQMCLVEGFISIESGLHLDVSLEVGCRGVITARNHPVLAMVAGMCRIRDVKKLRRTIGNIALVASHRIYLARNSNDWSSRELVKP